MTRLGVGWSRSLGAARRSASRAGIVAACIEVVCAATIVPPSTAALADLGALPRAALEAPIPPIRVVRLFNRPATQWAPGHHGIDLAAAIGDPLVPPSSGVVTFAGMVVDRGVVTVDFGGGVLSSVKPVPPTITVGAHVRRGETLGVVSSEAGHCAPLTCLHWGVRLNGVYINPLDMLLGFGRIVLPP